jgi:hypothetical protein
MSSATVIAARSALRQASAAQPARPRLPWRRWLVWAAVAVAVLLPAGLAVTLELRQPATGSTTTVSLAGQHYEFPSGLVRSGSARDGVRIDLAFTLPEIAPVRLSDATSADAATRDLGSTVLVAITPADDMPDPARRLTDLHARFLDQALNAAPGGLMMRAFRQNSPYRGETLVFAPPDGRLFWARCSDAASEHGTAAVCLSEARRDGLDFQIRFDPAQLANWDMILSAATGLAARARR